ncbi:MAG TPA: bpX6 domain-containing protein, partial [Polyangiaceae bacterium]|nr:bpX6 domain-containing protein [Polyangiaceae bacterium]
MSEVRLRRPIHHGSVLAAGLAIDTRLVPEPIARRRILELSSVVQQVRRAEAQLITVFRDPVRMSCASALGTPLVRQGRLLSAAPLERDEQ